MTLERTLVGTGWSLTGDDRRCGGPISVPGRGGRDDGMRVVPGSRPRRRPGSASRDAAWCGCSGRSTPGRCPRWWPRSAAWSCTWSTCWMGASHHGVRQVLSRVTSEPS